MAIPVLTIAVDKIAYSGGRVNRNSFMHPGNSNHMGKGSNQTYHFPFETHQLLPQSESMQQANQYAYSTTTKQMKLLLLHKLK